MRLDVYLTEQGLASSRTRAQELIKAGCVSVGGKPMLKSSYDVTDDDLVELTGTDHPYVGRGGQKLDGALKRFGVTADGVICADIGASTGGFTDCLLQHGARHVYAIDAGHGQLDRRLQKDSRVTNLEGVNARYMSDALLPESVSLAVADLSFISLTMVLSSVRTLLNETGELIALIKPQFECGRDALSKNGIVRDPKQHITAIRRVLSASEACGLHPIGIMKSPITGGDGNTEFLFRASVSGMMTVTDSQIREVVHE